MKHARKRTEHLLSTLQQRANALSGQALHQLQAATSQARSWAEQKASQLSQRPAARRLQRTAAREVFAMSRRLNHLATRLDS